MSIVVGKIIVTFIMGLTVSVFIGIFGSVCWNIFSILREKPIKDVVKGFLVCLLAILTIYGIGSLLI